MGDLEAVDAAFFDSAPKVIRRDAFIAKPRAEVFAAVAADPAGWGRWFPGFTTDGRWETPPPHGVGSVRVVRAFGVTYRETILVWDEGDRWAFRIDHTSAPAFRAFAEDYRFADDGAGTRWSWTVALRPAPLARPIAPLLPFGLAAIQRRAAARLGRL